MRTLLVCATLLLAGCGPKYPPGGIEVGSQYYNAYVREVALKDGTRCAVMVGTNRGGITCDWGTHGTR